MPTERIEITVPGEKSFSIHVGMGILPDLSDLVDLARYSGAVIVADENTLALFGETLRAALDKAGLKVDICTLSAGEASKSLAEVERAYRFLIERGIDRDALLCALGGGVTGDVTGFVASTYLRGLDFIQIPTTLLAQVDSAIGGKTGVNLLDKKNIIGSFYQPRAIVADTALLDSLPEEEMRSGSAEVIKYGLALDAELFKMIEQNARGEFSRDELPLVVARCAALKADIISRDETDRSGLRAVLNFGHTVGHAVETAGGLKQWRHGEAVSLGMVAAVRISAALGVLPDAVADKTSEVLGRFGLPVACPEIKAADIEAALGYDKKMSAGNLKWVLLKGIGHGVTGCSVPMDTVRLVLKGLCR
jgi:3-dehydroquinate synthase